MDELLNKLNWSSYIEETKKRNKKIVSELAKGDLSYGDIGKKYGLTRSRISQIGIQFGVKSPLKKGLRKTQTWRERIAKSRTKKRS